MKKLSHTTNLVYSASLIVMVLVLWQIATGSGWVPAFMLPSPVEVVRALVKDMPTLLRNAKVTLAEAGAGLVIGTALGLFTAILMNRFEVVYRAVYPLVVLTQTIPTIAIAPLLVLWLGYGMAPKVALIVIVTFFPITVALYDGFQSQDRDMVRLMQAMGAGRAQIFRFVTWPAGLPSFYAGLRMAVSYAVVGGVIAEWIGGDKGLGVYMTLAQKSYAYDKMFAVILFISLMSLILIGLVGLLQKLNMPWEEKQ